MGLVLTKKFPSEKVPAKQCFVDVRWQNIKPPSGKTSVKHGLHIPASAITAPLTALLANSNFVIDVVGVTSTLSAQCCRGNIRGKKTVALVAVLLNFCVY